MSYVSYNFDHFIKKFENINDNQCTIGKISTGGLDEPLRFDCLGHCQDASGRFNKGEQWSLLNLVKNPVQIWDGKHAQYRQQTPRMRLLAALRDLKERSR